ncbi:hypothetical protein C8F04DRAFT_1186443 [Mycena alexandri]|uniref:CxC2-like cysteine cluster KDZ transposase-associated domain-containing protein n=1 Tax=Mycena alexandri TaxID=1745969 RepID=A0AAD6WZA5_9AGAR|nr:hypothetical protein C8F04DRAFT_1186443 [Mycena alexandri]
MYDYCIEAGRLQRTVKDHIEVLVPLSALKIARSWYSGGRCGRKRAERELIANSDEEGSDTGRPHAVDRIVEQHIHRGPDGRKHREFAIIETVASPTKAKKPLAGLRPDIVPLEPFALTVDDFVPDDEAPIYDMLPKEPRALRPSDNPLGEWVRKKKPQTYLDELIQLKGRGERLTLPRVLHGRPVLQSVHRRWASGYTPAWCRGGSLEMIVGSTANIQLDVEGRKGTVLIRFLRMTREWRHIEMLKRAGRGHDPTGVETTQPGECALLCPACPQPGKNLPPGWEDAPKARRFLYALFLALDANFRMRRKKVSSEEKDPSLGDGWSFYCEIAPYYNYLAANWKQKQERSTCVAHDAVDKPDRESRGTASSGIATVDCARHNMKRPNSVGDLQLGERYINMDYIFFIGLAGSKISELFVSYDIACQWHKNIWERMKTFDQKSALCGGKSLQYPFLLPPHAICRDDGRGGAAGWAMLNPLASSTAEMGPGMRRDMINHTFNDMNHKKILGLGKSMSNKLVDCVPELIAASTELEELEASLRGMGAGATLEEWRVEIEAWEGDASNPNLFARKGERRTVVDVRWQMAEEVQKDMEQAMDVDGAKDSSEEGDDEGASAEMHATEWIGMGLQLEELQHMLGFDVRKIGNHPTAEQQTNLTERGNKLRGLLPTQSCVPSSATLSQRARTFMGGSAGRLALRLLLTWMDAQVLIIPHVAVLQAEEDRARKRISAMQVQPGVQVQHMALWLPSSINGRVPCDTELYDYEFRLREVQAHEALDDVRHQLLLRTHLYKYKDRFARGVKANSRSQMKIEGVEERTRRSAERYRAAWRALKALGRQLKQSGWEKALQPLMPEDVRGMPRALFQDPERKKLLMKKGSAARQKAQQAGAEAKARMSWIWRSPGLEEEEEGEMNEALRIEWAKTRARFLRQSEQLDLLEEEMR